MSVGTTPTPSFWTRPVPAKPAQQHLHNHTLQAPASGMVHLSLLPWRPTAADEARVRAEGARCGGGAAVRQLVPDGDGQ